MIFRTLTAAVALVLASACGGGGGGDGGLDDAVGTTGVRDDQAVARDVNLRTSDFPTEWRGTPLPADAQAVNDRNSRELAQCMGRPPPDEIRTALTDSEDFSAVDTRRVTSSVQVVRTEELAKGDFEALRTDRAVGCHRSQIEGEFRRQLPGASPQVALERLPMPTFGDETVAFRVDATSLAEGVQVRTFIDLVFVRKGRIEISANFINRTVPFPSDLERSLLQRMVGRA